MKKYINTICKSPLFSNMQQDDILLMIKNINGHINLFKKGEYIIHTGDKIKEAGIVLNGNVCIEKNDYWGNTQILTQISPGNIFGETYAIFPKMPSGVNAYSVTDSTVLFININKLYGIAASNLIKVLANKNLVLTEKLEHISARTIRDKILSFLSSYSDKYQNSSFKIPYNRQQLADYLAVDRSALSRELSKLKSEKIIDFNKNNFALL